MILFALAYLGGALTIVSPCILPVLPFVFARAGRPFVSSVLPMLLGMAATFAAVASLAAIGGGWAVAANAYGRLAAIALLAVFGITLLFPALSDHMTRPLVALGARLSQSAVRLPTMCSRSSSSTLACRPTRSPSAEPWLAHRRRWARCYPRPPEGRFGS